MSLFKKIWKIAFINDLEGFFPKFLSAIKHSFCTNIFVLWRNALWYIWFSSYYAASFYYVLLVRKKTCEAKSDEILKGVTEKNLQALIHFITLLEKEKLHKYVY